MAEQAFEQRQNCVIVATSALELGIDIDDLDRVIQIDAPATVTSFLQRMGRTGRRPETFPNCTFLATKDEAQQESGIPASDCGHRYRLRRRLPPAGQRHREHGRCAEGVARRRLCALRAHLPRRPVRRARTNHMRGGRDGRRCGPRAVRDPARSAAAVSSATSRRQAAVQASPRTRFMRSATSRSSFSPPPDTSLVAQPL